MANDFESYSDVPPSVGEDSLTPGCFQDFILRSKICILYYYVSWSWSVLIDLGRGSSLSFGRECLFASPDEGSSQLQLIQIPFLDLSLFLHPLGDADDSDIGTFIESVIFHNLHS